MAGHIDRDGPGRRAYDKLKCHNCDLLWEHLAQDRASSKEHICAKIGEVKKGLETLDTKIMDQAKIHSSFVPRWMFGTFVTLIIVAGGWWFGSFTNTVKDSQKEVKESLAVIHRRITETDTSRELLKDSLTEIKWSLNTVSTRLSEVEKKVNNQKP